MFEVTTHTRTEIRTSIGFFIKEDFCGFAKTKTHNIIGFPKYGGEIITIEKFEDDTLADNFLNNLMLNNK